MAKSKTPQEMSSEELEMANEILELERQQKEKELKKAVAKQEKELKKFEKEQAKLNGVPYVEEKSKKVEEPVQEEITKEEYSKILDNNDDITFDKLLSDFLKGVDPKKKKLRMMTIIENFYKAASDPNNKECLRASFFMVERVAGKSTPKTNNIDDDKGDPLVDALNKYTDEIKRSNYNNDPSI